MSEPAKVAVGDRASKPEPLSEQYYKSRKQLALYSALLFAWEFIGIELPENPFQNVDVSIKSPEAVPWVLVALIFYFGYRTLVEWYQSDQARRSLRVSRLDVYPTMAIPTAALVTFGVQGILKIQIVELLADPRVRIMVVIAISGLTMGSLTWVLLKARALERELRFRYISFEKAPLSLVNLIPLVILAILLVANIGVAFLGVPKIYLALRVILLVIPFGVGFGWAPLGLRRLLTAKMEKRAHALLQAKNLAEDKE